MVTTIFVEIVDNAVDEVMKQLRLDDQVRALHKGLGGDRRQQQPRQPGRRHAQTQQVTAGISIRPCASGKFRHRRLHTTQAADCIGVVRFRRQRLVGRALGAGAAGRARVRTGLRPRSRRNPVRAVGADCAAAAPGSHFRPDPGIFGEKARFDVELVR